eukprot:CAMPEP_0184713332 /NCGR_PEP_ID=MMETSP0314-20130426/3690_1 /TAXON_ID=38298 /ORGANISM="Rhodella maculata, Strain CCMP 736" /LENGTH=70 /DNA_ID=CAMNT_0027175945 /DNA_START=166 /DNA_END=378 /DNA_ORIENTATION=-
MTPGGLLLPSAPGAWAGRGDTQTRSGRGRASYQSAGVLSEGRNGRDEGAEEGKGAGFGVVGEDGINMLGG